MVRLATLALVAAACGDSAKLPDAAVQDVLASDAAPDADPNNPGTLFETGLCVDHACMQISPGVHAYSPRFALWADTASKRRWIYLPPGTQIDTTDMDHWLFPTGTKLWKEFTRDDANGMPVRVETRLVWKQGPTNTIDDWF